MISVDEQKSKEIISKIISYETKPLTLKNVFNEQELNQIRNVRDDAYKDQSRCAEKLLSDHSEPLGKMAHPNSELQSKLEKIIRPKLATHLTENYEMSFSFHRNLFPYGIHTDSGYDQDELIYKQGIIPLDVYPSSADVYTVVFDQKCYHSISYPKNLTTIETLSEDERSQIHNWSDQFDKAELSKYWESEDDFENFRGLSISLPFKWILGDMAIWDRAHLHCSSDFSVTNVDGKSGLMWISRRIQSA